MRQASLDDHERWKARGVLMLAVLFTILSYSTFVVAQKPEYDFYSQYRNNFTPGLRAENPSLSLTQEQIVERYATKLKEEGVSETEITRRARLLLTERNALEADYWNRYYLDSKSNFNRAPNDFLKQIAAGLATGSCSRLWNGGGPKRYLPSKPWMGGLGI